VVAAARYAKLAMAKERERMGFGVQPVEVVVGLIQVSLAHFAVALVASHSDSVAFAGEREKDIDNLLITIKEPQV